MQLRELMSHRLAKDLEQRQWPSAALPWAHSPACWKPALLKCSFGGLCLASPLGMLTCDNNHNNRS